MISDFIEDNIREDKASAIFHSMLFYNDIRVQNYQKNSLSVMRNNIDWITDGGTMQKDEVICHAAILAYMELCMAELMHRGIEEIREQNLIKNAEAIKTLQKIKFKRLKSKDKEEVIKWSLWNYEDEVLAMSSSVKKAVGSCISFIMENEDGDLTVSDMENMFDIIKENISNQGLPNVVGDELEKIFDTEEEEENALDLISKAMYSNNYIKTVVDFCLDS